MPCSLAVLGHDKRAVGAARWSFPGPTHPDSAAVVTHCAQPIVRLARTFQLKHEADSRASEMAPGGETFRPARIFLGRRCFVLLLFFLDKTTRENRKVKKKK